MSNLKRFLLYFAQDNVSFRLPEIKSLIKFFGIDSMNSKLPDVDDIKPYWILEDVAESDLRKIASRSVSLRFIAEVWSSGKGYNMFHQQLKEVSVEQQFKTTEFSFRVTVETYNKHFSHAEKIQKIDSLFYLPLNGRIELKNPDHNFIYFEFWGMDPMNPPNEPEEIVFGRWVRDF